MSASLLNELVPSPYAPYQIEALLRLNGFVPEQLSRLELETETRECVLTLDQYGTEFAERMARRYGLRPAAKPRFHIGESLMYRNAIRAITPERDPRHVEAFMRLSQGTLDHLDAEQFRAEAEEAARVIDHTGADFAETLAQSYGL